MYGVGPLRDANCLASLALFLGNNGDYLYKSMTDMQFVHEFNSLGAIEYIEIPEPRSDAVYPSKEGDLWYQRERYGVALMQREIGSCSYLQVSDALRQTNWQTSLLAFSEEDEYLHLTCQQA